MRYGDHSFFQTGVAVPLFSLRSKNSIGIGEFLDLIPFASWAKYCDFNVIQILPVNDTGNESSPYSARSAFALHPVYLNLQVIDGSSDFEDEIKKAKEDFNKELRIDFYKIVTWKRAILRKIFDLHFEKIAADKKLERWIDNNEWVKPYCVYALLKAKHSEASWKDWKTNQHPDRKSTRLNSSHQITSYAVFCLKKKKNQTANAHLSLTPDHSYRPACRASSL